MTQTYVYLTRANSSFTLLVLQVSTLEVNEVSLGYTHTCKRHLLINNYPADGCSQNCVDVCVGTSLLASDGRKMDISVLPNNNHPEKFLQLDVGMLPFTHGMFQVEAAMTGQRHWHNRVYSQVGGLETWERNGS